VHWNAKKLSTWTAAAALLSEFNINASTLFDEMSESTIATDAAEEWGFSS
jgi:hypothetical protein